MTAVERAAEDEGIKNENEVVLQARNAAVASAAVPKRRRRPVVQREIRAFLTSFDQAPKHLRDNPFIRRGYRVGHSAKDAIISAFKLHNESGNIWTHLIGFIVFLILTAVTVKLRPMPFRLGAEALTVVEERLSSLLSAKHTMYDLLKTAEEWERAVLKLGNEVAAPVETYLRSIGRHNLQELRHMLASSATELGANLENFGNSLGSSARDVSSRILAVGASASAELASLESKISDLSSEKIHDLEMAIRQALASILETRWPVSRWPMHVFTTGAMVCLLTSSMCHLFGCCAAHVSAVMWRFDYAGIAVLIVASFFPPVHYAFLCHPIARESYIISTTILGICVLVVTLLEKFQDPQWHAYRAILFSSLGLWGVVPLVHAWYLYRNVAVFSQAMHIDLAMGAIYLIGAAIYAFKVPERWKPGAFDVAFHSHQIFHVAVVIAAMLHYKACKLLMYWRDETGGCFGNVDLNTSTWHNF